jgi:hypothetical protein
VVVLVGACLVQSCSEMLLLQFKVCACGYNIGTMERALAVVTVDSAQHCMKNTCLSTNMALLRHNTRAVVLLEVAENA